MLQNALSVWNRDERVKLEPLTFSQTQYFRRTEFKGKHPRSRPPAVLFRPRGDFRPLG